MDEMERYQHQLHATLPAFQRKVTWSAAIIEDALKLAEGKRWQLSFSGGIDSTVLLHLVMQHPSWHDQVDVQWVDDGADFPETLQFLQEMEARYGFHLRRVRSLKGWYEFCMEMERPDLADDLSAWFNPPMQYDAVWGMGDDYVRQSILLYQGAFIGMLASESRSRFYQLRGGRRTLYQVKREQDMWHCCPLANWNKRDIWSYAVSRTLPYNPVYDRLAALDIPLEYRRVGPLTCLRTVQYGNYTRLQQGWPDLFNRLSAVFPHIRSFS